MARRVTVTVVFSVPDGDDEDCVQDALDLLDNGGFTTNTTFAHDGKRFIGTTALAGGADWTATVENSGG